MLNILGLRSILKGLTSVENSSEALSLVKQFQTMLQQNKALFSTVQWKLSEIQCHRCIFWKRRTGLLNSPRQEYFILGKNTEVWRHLPSWTALWIYQNRQVDGQCHFPLLKRKYKSDSGFKWKAGRCWVWDQRSHVLWVVSWLVVFFREGGKCGLL